LEAIQKDLPEDVKITTYYDQSKLVDRTIHTVQEVLTISSALVVITLFALMLNIRAALIVSLIIPLSLLFSFVMMWRTNLSANLMTVGAVDFGFIVDAGVVMVENIFRHLSERSRTHGHHDYLSIIRDSAQEVGRPIVFAVLIIIAVFIPLFALSGIEGKMFHP